MVPVNVAADFRAIPAWFEHAPGAGLTLPDFVVPAFLFSLGLSASFSFRARVRDKGFGRAFLHALVRYTVLFAFGSIGTLLVDHSARWEILQMLGVTGLLSFFFLLLRPVPRLAAAALLLAGVEVLRPLGLGALMNGWYDTGIAGPWGTFSLSFFAIVASSLGELVKDASSNRRLSMAALFAVALCAAAGRPCFFSPSASTGCPSAISSSRAGISSALLAALVAVREMIGHEAARCRKPRAKRARALHASRGDRGCRCRPPGR